THRRDHECGGVILVQRLFTLLNPPPPTSTLFPYTTLFRSSNLEAPPPGAVRLEEAWLQQNLLDNRLSWLVGRYDLNTEFYRLQRSEEHTSELQSRGHLVCRLLLEKKKKKTRKT